MRFYLVLAFLCANVILSGATYYVAPNGSDSNSGSITQPFLTLNKAWTVVAAGDIIYMRGGTYQYGTTMNVLADKSGTSSNPIKIWAYPGEYPVIDYAGVNLTGQKIGLRLHNINYVYFKGFRICNMAQQNISNAWPNYGVILYDDVSNCTFEQIEVDHIGGTGFTIADRCNNNLFLNCDSHHHQDPYSSEPYGMSDGFESGSHGANTSTNNTFRNCRSWSNSDDGWDLRQADGVYTIDGCWSFRNGFIPGTTTTGGNGDGYKLGGKTTPGTSAILRTIKNSLSFENRATGITPEPDASDNVFGLDIYNCTSYKNARDLGEGINTGNYNNYTRVRNCIAYANIHSNVWMQGGAVHDHNTWDIPKSVTDADFLSVNSTGTDGPRQADGSLPVINFLHLAAGSGLIDCGTDVGQSCVNTADLGAFEFQSVAPPPSPVYTSSSIENATPSLLEMTYSLSLANIIPASSAFLVSVNSVTRTINSIAISGTKIQLTLSSPVVYGDVVKVSYTKPSSNPLQSVAGGQAVTLAAQNVTNNVSAACPVYVSSAIQNASPSLLEMTYNLTLANIVPAASSFSVMVNSAARTVSTVAVAGAKVQLTLSTPVVYGDIVTVSYTKPSTNPLQSVAGGQAVSLAAQSVTNNVSAVSPVYVSAAIQNVSPSLLEMTYNLTLANIVPAASSFSVMVNSAARTVSAVVVTGAKVQLTLSTPVVYGDIVTVAYTKPSSNPLQSVAGGQAVTLAAQNVTNNVSAASPVYVSSAIQNASPSLLEMTYNLTLANIVPAISSFSVMVNSAARTVSSVAVTGAKVQLTLSTPVVYGDIVTVAYTKPSSNPLQSAAGSQAVTLAAQSVTNNVNATSPVYVSSAIQNASPSLLEMTYNLTLANIVPAASSFSVMVNSATRTVSAVAVTGAKVQLTLSTPVVYGDIVTVSYTKPASNALQTSSGGQAISLGAQSVTNNVIQVSSGYYYVSPVGSDSNPGTISQPFFTLNKAWSVVAAGNTIYVRGGTYHYGTSMSVLSDKSGTSSATIKIMAYPGENPVIDYSGVNLTGQKIGLRLHNINYVNFKGIRICNIAQENISNAWADYGIILYDDVNNCTFEQMEVDHIGGTGFTIADRCNNNLFLNCDSHHNQDPHSSSPYDMADGFESGSHGSNSSTNNIFRNCRAWSNSDDGWDLGQADGIYSIENCWSFRNGFIPGTSTQGGNGNGFKIGGKTSPATNSILRTIKNSLAFENRATGITPEPDGADQILGIDILSCTSYMNARDLGEGINTGNYNNYARVRNCISYANIHSNVWMQAGAVNDHNSWDIPRTVTDADFISVSSTGTDGARQADGSLPVTTFLHLAAGSDLIDAGVNSGLAYTGIAPDLGAFESQVLNSAPVTSIITPSASSSFKASANIQITASATDKDGFITLVEFYNGSVKLGSVTAAPYTFSWNNVAAGTYSLTVIATDNQNGKTVSSAVSVTVTPRNRHPYVSIATPVKGSTYENLSTISINAIAFDPDGTITRVEFYNGSVKLAALTSAPYSFDWKDVAPGSYSVSAIATDNLNDTTASETVKFEIKAAVKANVQNNEFARIENLYPNPSDGHFSVQFTNNLQNEKSEITVTDVTGRKVYSGQISQAENLKYFDFSQLKSGIYVMMIKDKQQILTKKFIIK